MEGLIWRAGWCQEWRAGQSGESWERARWGKSEEHRVWARTGPLGRSCCELPYKWLRGVCLRSEWSHGKKLATILDILLQFESCETILD